MRLKTTILGACSALALLASHPADARIWCTWDEFNASPPSEHEAWPVRWRAEADKLEREGGPDAGFAKACRSLATAVEAAHLEAKLKMTLPDARIGMSESEVRTGRWGEPNHVNTTTTAAGVREQWVYPHGYLYFQGGRLVSIETSTR